MLVVAVGSMRMEGWKTMFTLLPDPEACTIVTPANPTIWNWPLFPLLLLDAYKGIARGCPIID